MTRPNLGTRAATLGSGDPSDDVNGGSRDGSGSQSLRESIPDSRPRGARCSTEGPAVGLKATTVAEIAADLRVLADPVRLQLLDVLSRNEGMVCVCDLEAAVPVKRPTVSHHLGILRRAGIVDSERRGLWAYYFLNRARLDGLWATVADLRDALAGERP